MKIIIPGGKLSVKKKKKKKNKKFFFKAIKK
jgi:hypothetical protein